MNRLLRVMPLENLKKLFTRDNWVIVILNTLYKRQSKNQYHI